MPMQPLLCHQAFRPLRRYGGGKAMARRECMQQTSVRRMCVTFVLFLCRKKCVSGAHITRYRRAHASTHMATVAARSNRRPFDFCGAFSSSDGVLLRFTLT